jgi:hypothetical protein
VRGYERSVSQPAVEIRYNDTYDGVRVADRSYA